MYFLVPFHLMIRVSWCMASVVWIPAFSDILSAIWHCILLGKLMLHVLSEYTKHANMHNHYHTLRIQELGLAGSCSCKVYRGNLPSTNLLNMLELIQNLESNEYPISYRDCE